MIRSVWTDRLGPRRRAARSQGTSEHDASRTRGAPRRPRPVLWRALLGLVVVALVAASCGNDSDDASSSEDGTQSTETIRIGLTPTSESLAVWVAYEQGLFEEHGLDVELTEIAGAGLAPTALSAGDVDLALETPVDFLLAKDGGLDLVAVAGLSASSSENARVSILARPDVEITRPADLEGLRIATPARGNVGELGVAYMVAEDGGEPSRVQWVEVPFPQMADALASDRADAATPVVPFIGALEAEGMTNAEADVSYADIDDPLLITFLSGLRDWAEDHESQILAIRDALDEAVQLITEDGPEIKEVEAQYTGLDPAIVAGIPYTNFVTVPTTEMMETWIAVLKTEDPDGFAFEPEDLVFPAP